MKFLKVLAMVLALCFCVSAAEFVSTYVLTATGTDSVPPVGYQKCDYFLVDCDGIVKVDYTDYDSTSAQTIVIQVYAGIPVMIQNVKKLYRYYVGTTAGTAKTYSAAGALVSNAIRLCKRKGI